MTIFHSCPQCGCTAEGVDEYKFCDKCSSDLDAHLSELKNNPIMENSLCRMCLSRDRMMGFDHCANCHSKICIRRNQNKKKENEPHCETCEGKSQPKPEDNVISVDFDKNVTKYGSRMIFFCTNCGSRHFKIIEYENNKPQVECASCEHLMNFIVEENNDDK